ncbi:unnamed protein product [Closterium sp. NIES-53]
MWTVTRTPLWPPFEPGSGLYTLHIGPMREASAGAAAAPVAAASASDPCHCPPSGPNVPPDSYVPPGSYVWSGYGVRSGCCVVLVSVACPLHRPEAPPTWSPVPSLPTHYVQSASCLRPPASLAVAAVERTQRLASSLIGRATSYLLGRRGRAHPLCKHAILSQLVTGLECYPCNCRLRLHHRAALASRVGSAPPLTPPPFVWPPPPSRLSTSTSGAPPLALTLRVLEIVVSTLEVLAPGVLESGLSLRLSETLVLGGAGIGGAFPGVATPGGAGAPSSRPGETGTGRVAAGGANSGGDTTGAVESGAGATACSDATPPPHPYPTQHQALLRLGCEEQRSPPRPSLSMLPSPPESSLTTSSSTPVTDYYYTYRPILSRILASLVTDPRASLSSVSTLTAAVTDFATTRCLDYATRVVAAPPTRALSIRGEYASGCDAPEDRQFELEFLAAASPLLCAMLLAPEGDSDALDIPTPHTYAEAVPGPWASQWRAAMDAEVASYRSTCTYVDEVPPSGANVVQGMWIFKVKRPPGSPPDFKARYVARGSSQHKGVDFFQTFAPTSKMTTVQVLLHVAAHRDYELHSLDLSTAFLQGSLHKEVWLSRSSGFTDTFPPGTQWRLRRPVCSLR